MQKASYLFFILCCFGQALAQGGFTKGTKGNDYIIVTNDGIHFSLGATYLMPSQELSGNLSDNNGARKLYAITPKGQLGFFAEVGLAHFPKWKGIPIKPLKKSRIMDYVDWGVGFRQYAGTEATHIDIKNDLNQIILTQDGSGSFRNNYVFARVSAHTLIYYGKKKIDKVRKHFIDQSIGFNFDYNLFPGKKDYDNNFTSYQQDLNFQKNFMAQFHYSLGIGIRLNRAWMMIPSVDIPLVGIYQWNGFNARMNWYSSQYWPIQVRLKFLKLFERPPKCGVYGDPKDRDLDKQFRMGN